MAEARSLWRSWGCLLRLPNLFTVPGDAIAGGTFAIHGQWSPLRATGTCLSVLLLYAAGLLLNDYFDRAEDARERPNRPIPSGEVRPGSVLLAGNGCLVGGIVSAWLVGGYHAGLVALLLTMLIYTYDAGGRKLPLGGPILMGLCRACSVLLGALCIGGLSIGVYTVAGAALLYTASITFVAKDETLVVPIGKKVFVPALCLFTITLTGLALILPNGSARLFFGFIMTAAFAEALLAAVPVYQGKRPVPPYIGRLIRIMLTVQAAWIVMGSAPLSNWAAVGVCMLFIGLRGSADLMGKRFYGS